ncbi:hypothetical protein B0T20DRAFT_453495 [Sordaria brevicollis]|uniref:RNA exonuclease 4 n=1 Tax=Sordaria brevicollis TaxID=83679 RepID=A0AAE0UC97_SORBR|nr:hypothetical protein B0T20DRAFT_453495 [Sordaria brevicollis]
MAPADLSSNWKKLQEKLKSSSSSSTTTGPRTAKVVSQEALFKQATSKKSISSETLKRKAEESKSLQASLPAKKKQRTDKPPRKFLQAKLAAAAASAGGEKGSGEGKEEKVGKGTTTGENKMGGVQSQPSASTSKHTITPSLHLWAAEEGISPESLAEAYNLGLRTSSSHIPLLSTLPPAIPNAGLTLPGQSTTSSSSLTNGTNGLPLPSSLPLPNGTTLSPETTSSLTSILHATTSSLLGKYLAIDCEMVGTGPTPSTSSILARCSLVDFLGNQLFDSYVLPTARVTDWRTPISGISPKHMRAARPFAEVQTIVAALLKGRVLVGHDVKHDLEVLGLEHPWKDVRDTAKYGGYKKFGNGPKPSLKVVEDARVAMLLFRKEKGGFDMEVSNRYDAKEEGQGKGKGGGGKKKKKKKGGK